MHRGEDTLFLYAADMYQQIRILHKYLSTVAEKESGLIGKVADSRRQVLLFLAVFGAGRRRLTSG